MESLIELHKITLKLINDIKQYPNNYYSQYSEYLVQIDRILIALDILNQGQSN